MSKFFLGLAVLLIAPNLCPLPANGKKVRQEPAQLTLHAHTPGCSVDLDNKPVGKTDDHGALVVSRVEPGDHYLHLTCPGETENEFFITPHSGEIVALDESKALGVSKPVTDQTFGPADMRDQLRQLVREAAQLRTQGKFDETVARLRAAVRLDPANSDLHRELGITFLLCKQWKRARVEMQEAIRHDSGDADAYNGLGYALEKMDELDDAVKQYRKATQLDPNDSTYRTHYFDALARLAGETAKKK